MRTDIVLSPIDARVSELLDAARAAEAAGFGGVFTYDHLSGRVFDGDHSLDVFTLLGALAGATSTIALGPLVANATLRHPSRLAVAAATLQELSGGRMILGLGAGAGRGSTFARELTMVGLDAADAATRRRVVAETVQVVKALWRGEAEHGGELFRLDGAAGFLRPEPAPPIVVGANGPKMAALAGTWADGVCFHSTQEGLAEMVALARRAAGGRPFVVMIDAPFDEALLDDTSPARAALRALDVDRVALTWRAAMGVSTIDRAAPLLEGTVP